MSAPPDASLDAPEPPAAPAPRATPTQPWRDPLWRLRWLVPFAALAVALIITGRAHWLHLQPFVTPVSNDEGYISALALRMLHGHWLPYVDGVSQRGPVIYWLAALAMKVGGQFSWMPIRMLALGAGFSTVLLTFVVTAEYATPFAAGIAALFVTYFFSYELNPWDGVGYNGEVVAMQFVLASMLCVGRAQRPPERAPRSRDRWLLAAGFLAALAGLSKQMTLIHALPSLGWLMLGRADARDPTRARAKDVALFVAAGAVPYALVVGIYAASGHLREFVYYYQRYGRDIFMAPLTADYMREKLREQIDKYYLGIATVSAIGVVGLSRAMRALVADESRTLERLRRHMKDVIMIAQLACGVVGASFTWRFFPHYFVQVFPVAAVVAGSVAASLDYEPTHPRDRGPVAGAATVVLGAALILVVASSALHRVVRLRRETDRWYQDPHADPIVRYVLEKTRPEDRIFVWGFRAETYVSSGRLPASRYVYTVYPSGVVPWFQSTREEEERRVVPGSRQLLLDDLERERPVLVIDAGRSMNGRYMYNYPVMRTYLDRNYCFMRYVDGEPVYRRRQHGDCPPADY